MNHSPTPSDDEVPASSLQLPVGNHANLLEGLCAHFPRIDREQWLDRFHRGRVLDQQGLPLAAETPYRVGSTVRYFREVQNEPVVPFAESVVYQDRHLVVADKPHFLPVAPSGAYVRQTLLARLVRRLDNPDLAPLHRIDRDTAGLVLFSADRSSRGAYQALFREQRIEKRYEALAPALPGVVFPRLHESRIVPGQPFFRMREEPGPANAITRIELLGGEGACWRYALFPVTGRKHQLRVQMAGLGAPIQNDRTYPQLMPAAADDHARPLQLLARALSFEDPLNGAFRHFESGFRLGHQG